MNWLPIMTFLAAAAGAAGVTYLAWVAYVCISEARSDERARTRLVARRHSVWTAENSR